jgi:hypothetical protein
MFNLDKRILVLLTAFGCFTDGEVEAKAIKCIYMFKDVEASPFFHSIIETLHDELRLKFEETALSDHPFETIDAEYSVEAGRGMEFIYHVTTEESPADIKTTLEMTFKGIKASILQADLEEVAQLLQNQLLKKINGLTFSDQEKVMAQFNSYQKSFKLDQLLQNLEFSVCEEKELHSLVWREFEFDHFDNYCFYQISDVPEVYELTLSEREKQIIHHIISEMGSKSLFALLRKRSEMLKCGDQIRNVPPMDFLGYIFSQPDLKKHMHSIKKSHFKWQNILDEVGANMSKESKHQTFQDKVESFSRFLQVDSNVLKQKAERKDWSGFVNSLM